MAIGFNKAKGAATSTKIDYMKLAEGVNQFRIIGGLLPMYQYWVESADGKNIPVECLQFDRYNERFDNTLPDPVKEMYPEAKCGWSYKCQVINRATGKVEVLQLKKAILEGVMSVAEQLEIDPSDPDNGVEVFVKRVKTGPLAYNVSYEVQQLKMSKISPLSDEDRKLVSEAKTIDELFPRPTVEEQRALLVKLATPKTDSASESNDEEAMDELED